MARLYVDLDDVLAQTVRGLLRLLERSPVLVALLLLLPVGGARAETPIVGETPIVAEAPIVGETPIVILLSWDGVRHDYPDWGELPALARLEREGLRAERLVPPFPSVTFPGHATLATGTHPDRHGIVANEFWDGTRHYVRSKDASWLEAEPLWIAAERQGVRSAVFFWVGSETDWRGRRASYRRTPFDSALEESEKVDQLLAWLDLPEPQRPGLLMAWWHGADRVGHRQGPRRREIARQLAGQDAQLMRLLAGIDERGLWQRTTLIVTSDHGMAFASRNVDADGALARAGVEATLARAGGCAFVYLARAGDLERARTALAELRDVTVHARDEIPERLRVRHGARTGDLLLVARPPAMFARLEGAEALLVRLAGLFGRGMGMHGYEPEVPEMGAIFLALGRGVPAATRLGAVRAIDVAPTVAALLGIDPPAQSEGRVLPGIVPPAQSEGRALPGIVPPAQSEGRALLGAATP